MFENRLTGAIRAINFSKQLESQHVKRVIEEADGYQPHLVAPEMGYRRLLQECLVLFKVRDRRTRVSPTIVANSRGSIRSSAGVPGAVKCES